MTPSREKQPLPSSKSITVNHGRPNSFQEWQPVLKEVKLLFMKRLWTQCKLRCDWLLDGNLDLINPVHACYLQFYAALSDELFAVSMHSLAATKLPLLRSSKGSYAAALTSLRKSSNFDDKQCQSDRRLSFDSYVTSVPYTPTPAARIPPTAPPSPLYALSPPRRLIQSQSWTTDFSSGSPTHKPSPLRIRKLTSKPCMLSTELDAPYTPPSSPPPYNSVPAHTPASVTLSDCTTTWLHDRTLQRFNEHLQDFDEMVLKHIETIDTLIQSTEEAQANLCAGKQSVSDKTENEVKAPDRKARIKEIIANGWKRERYRPERYQELCVKALAEL